MEKTIKDFYCQEHGDSFQKCRECFQMLCSAKALRTQNKLLLGEMRSSKLKLSHLSGEVKLLEKRLEFVAEESKLARFRDPSLSLRDYLHQLELPNNFFQICKDSELSLSFLLKSDLLPSSRECHKCFQAMNLENHGYAGYLFVCAKCRVQSSVKQDTFWHGLQMPPQKIVTFLFLWVLELKDSEIANMVDATQKSVSYISRKMRQLVSKDYCSKLPKFSGVVEIEVNNFIKRKIEIGKGKRPPKWVLVMFERETKLVYLEVIPKKSPECINSVIQKQCEIGTTCITKRWGAFGRLENLGYPHYTYDEERGVADPEDKLIHTNNVKTTWLWAKYETRKRNRKALYLQEHLLEWQWRRWLKRCSDRGKLLQTAEVFKALVSLVASSFKSRR